MAKRTAYTASADGIERTTYAWNSAIVAAQAIVREIGRAEGQTYTGAWPELDGVPAHASVKRTADSVLTRTWTGDRTGRVIVTTVRQAQL